LSFGNISAGWHLGNCHYVALVKAPRQIQQALGQEALPVKRVSTFLHGGLNRRWIQKVALDHLSTDPVIREKVLGSARDFLSQLLTSTFVDRFQSLYQFECSDHRLHERHWVSVH
jgi:hypothetical protein